MSAVELQVVYDGPALASHEMEVRDLAPALLAIGDLFEAANAELNGKRAKVAVSVRGSFKTGCFAIDLQVAQSMASQVKELLLGDGVTAALNLAQILGLASVAGGSAYAGVIQVIKWLRGRSITKVISSDDGKATLVTQDGQLEIEQAVLRLLRNVEVRQALESAITKPLQRDGIEYFASRQSDGTDFVSVNRSESGLFVSPTDEQEEEVSVGEREVSLQLVSIAFREDNKWRLTDGAATFYAVMADQEFIDRIDSNDEAFSKGDILRVQLHERAVLVGGQLKRDYTVLKVIEHRTAARQLRLPMG